MRKVTLSINGIALCGIVGQAGTMTISTQAVQAAYRQYVMNNVVTPWGDLSYKYATILDGAFQQWAINGKKIATPTAWFVTLTL